MSKEKQIVTVKCGGLYTINEVAELLGTSAQQVYKLISAGLIPALKLGRLKIRPAALEAFLEKYEGYDLSDPSNPQPLVKDQS